jgi:hypothetical protein
MGVRFTGKEGSTEADGGAQSYVSPLALARAHAMPALGDGPDPEVHWAAV